MLEPRITQYGCLDILDPNKAGKTTLNLFDTVKAKEENKGADKEEDRYLGACYTRETLRGQIQEALEKVCKRLNESYEVDGVPRCILVEPSAALYSTIEKFYLVMFADKASQRRWEEFYVNFRDEIWSSVQQRIPQSVVRQWNADVDDLLALLGPKPQTN